MVLDISTKNDPMAQSKGINFLAPSTHPIIGMPDQCFHHTPYRGQRNNHEPQTHHSPYPSLHFIYGEMKKRQSHEPENDSKQKRSPVVCWFSRIRIMG